MLILKSNHFSFDLTRPSLIPFQTHCFTDKTWRRQSWGSSSRPVDRKPVTLTTIPQRMSQKVRKSSPSSSKQGPMRATLPMSSLLRQGSNLRKSKSNSPTLSPTSSWKTRISPDAPSTGQRSPGSINYKGKSHLSPGCGGPVIRRTASLDTLYLQGQWPTESFYSYCGHLLVDKSTQVSAKLVLSSALDKFKLLSIPRHDRDMNAVRLSLAMLCVPGPPSRESVSPLIAGPMDTSRPPSDVQAGSRDSTPEQEASKLGTSPHINKFLAREPPDGCEKVNLKFMEDSRSLVDLSKLEYCPKKPCLTLKPSQGSAFYPLHREGPSVGVNGEVSLVSGTTNISLHNDDALI
uniref:Uncharacterized protein n=1 Tax=Timema douglasi TaxID=61478 RepID=A0A7R8VPH0_TIMDO|nr:unnamed protein product [Timema douglasi]